jgi:pimeloyl-ACP methyl ester carboxylesterase
LPTPPIRIQPSEAEGFSHKHATISGVRYHYVRELVRPEGASLLLFLIHGWPGFHYERRLNIKPLARRSAVVVPDMRGYHRTDEPELVNQAITEFIAP